MGLKVLSALDTAKTQYYHFKAIIIAGMGLFTDAYDLFSIGPINILLSYIYYPTTQTRPYPPHFPAAVSSTMVGIALAGTVAGQLLFGRLGDLVGRRRVYGFALALMILSSIGCGFSICTTRGCVLSSLAFFRFLLGFGIGGDYPLSATIMSEFANKATRGAFIAAVFSMQGLGILFSSVVTMVVCAVFERVDKAAPGRIPPGADLAWRIILMFGAVPAGVTFYWRMMMPETARYTALVEHNVKQAAKDMEKVLEVSANQIAEETSPSPASPTSPSSSSSAYHLLSKQFLHNNGGHLSICAASWFLLDIIFYSTTLFQSHIYHFILPDRTHHNAYRNAYDLAKFQAIIAVCSTIPGYWATVFFIDHVGRRKIQIAGFILVAATLFSIGGTYPYWSRNHGGAWFLVLYGLVFFFSNFGPNTTTFIIPAELFPARFRTTCHGISGAAGKVGAIVGSIGLAWTSNHDDEDGKELEIRMKGALVALGVVSLIGALITYLFTPETKGRSLEENEGGDFLNRRRVEEGTDQGLLQFTGSPFSVRGRSVEIPDQGVDCN